LAASKSPLAGDWAGVYFIGSTHTAVRFYFAATLQGLKGTMDLPGQNGGFNLASLKTSDRGFSGETSYIGKKMAFEANLEGSHLNGGAIVNGEHGKLELARLAKVELAKMRPWEGIYRLGTRSLLFESLNEAYPCSAVELPSGMIRSLFPINQNQFIAGPTLLEAQPENQRYTFVQDSTGNRRVLIVRGGATIKASQVPLHSEEVKFENGNVNLVGTLILPNSHGPHPAIIFMHGSGGSPRISYFGFGYWLASREIAVLKYDKRGSGQSTGSFTTYEDLGEDAAAGARFLQSRPEIDPKRIGFWGISEGGWTAPEAASRFSEAAFVICVSGGGLSPAAGEIYDSEDALRSDGRFSEADIQQALAFQNARDHYAQTSEGWDAYQALFKVAITKPWYNYPTTDLFGAAKPDSPFWKTKARTYFYDPLPALRKVRCPLLALRGGFDDPVGGTLGVRAMQRGLAEGGNRKFTSRVIPRGNHELFEAKSGATDELPRTKRFCPGVLPLMTRWIEEQTRRLS
jgi:pimeloyl-ACP methyl ester carboxylesterase